MKNSIEEIVHIIALGHEYDRAVRPFDSVKANRVYLITDTGEGTGIKERDEPLQELQENTYTPRVKEYLEQKGIDVKIVKTKTFDMTVLLKTITHIIKEEKDKGNKVLINMSSSGKLGAAASTMAGMAHNVTVYYVHADRYASDSEKSTSGLSVCSSNNITILPNMDILLPEKDEIGVLKELYLAKENHETASLSASQISDIISPEDDCDEVYSVAFESKCIICESSISPGIDEYKRVRENEVRDFNRAVQSRNLMRVGGLMRKMEEKGYVTKEKIGRKMMYEITDRGVYALVLSGVL